MSSDPFVISADTLAEGFRQKKQLEDIKLLNKEFKISQYVDDTCSLF